MESNLNQAIINHLNSVGTISFVPKGNSMWPTLKHKGQSVIVQKKQERLSKFDVVLFVDQNGTLVLHRVMQVTDDGYVTRGDSQVNFEKVPEQNVIGVMIGFYQKNQYVDVNSEKHLLKVKNWLKDENKRIKKIKKFYISLKVKGKIKRIFCKKGK